MKLVYGLIKFVRAIFWGAMLLFGLLFAGLLSLGIGKE